MVKPTEERANPIIDLAAYLQRVGLSRGLDADLASLQCLQTLHLAHASTIPFENVDVRLRRPILLDLVSLQAKLVQRRRGGYCFEQNTLFAAVLGELGFRVRCLEARVRLPTADVIRPRTHMTLAVQIGDRSHLVDVGFGADGPLVPVPLDGSISEQLDTAYAVSREHDGGHVLRQRERDAWRDLYAFSLVPALPVDFEVASHFTSTHPSSGFVRTLTAQRSLPTERHVLRGRTYTTRIRGVETSREIRAEEVADILRDTFDIDVTDEEARTAFREG